MSSGSMNEHTAQHCPDKQTSAVQQRRVSASQKISDVCYHRKQPQSDMLAQKQTQTLAR